MSTVWPVSGCAGEYVNDATGTAQAGATTTPTRSTTEMKSKRRTTPIVPDIVCAPVQGPAADEEQNCVVAGGCELPAATPGGVGRAGAQRRRRDALGSPRTAPTYTSGPGHPSRYHRDAMPDRLYFTDSDEANALIASDPMALLVGFALDQQVPVQKAFSGPLVLRERLGAIDAATLAAADLEPVFRAKPALHRYPGAMAKRVHDARRPRARPLRRRRRARLDRRRGRGRAARQPRRRSRASAR